MDWGSCFISGICLTFGLALSFFVFHKRPSKELVSRLPLFLTCAVPGFYLGIADLPFALQSPSMRIFGHSIWDMARFRKPAFPSGCGWTWWTASWLAPLLNTVLMLLLTGILWAFINAVMGRQRRVNTAGAVVGFTTVLLAVYFMPMSRIC
jgi:hypothetical protein